MPVQLDVAGTKVHRVITRPHEIRLYLSRGEGEWVLMRFWPADDTSVDGPADGGGVLTDAVVDEREDGVRVQLVSGDDVRLEVSAPSWTWRNDDPEEDPVFWDLAPEERQAVRELTEAVVRRDKAVVDAHLGEGQMYEDFWYEPDTYDDGKPVAIAVPPGPLDEWEAECMAYSEGRVEIRVQMFNADTPKDPTDLSLIFDLVRDDDGFELVIEGLRVS